MNYNETPRAELIAELNAWETKFKSKVRADVKKEKDKLKIDIKKAEVAAEKFLNDKTEENAREVLAWANRYVSDSWLPYYYIKNIKELTLELEIALERGDDD